MPLWLRLTLFAFMVLGLVSLTSVYVLRRAARTFDLNERGRYALAGVLVVAPTFLLIARGFESVLPPSLAFVLGVVGFTLVLGVLISAVLLFAVELPFVLNGLRKRRQSAEKPADPPAPAQETVGTVPDPASVGRREAIRRTAMGTALTVGFGSAFYGALFGRHDYDLPEVPIPIPGLNPRLSGYRIVQISDIHFGVYVGDAEHRAAVELVRRARPDLVVLTGDLVDRDAAYAPSLGRLIRALDELGARDGVVVIPGNHDYYTGVDIVLGVSARAGATVLRNDGRVIGDSFALVGVDDVWTQRNGYAGGPDLPRALAQVPEDLPKVLLCHNPVFFEEARGQVALQLSGHTHGGQVNLGVRPADLLLPYVHGLYEEDGSRLYVNRGFGTAGPPARVDAPPEVTVVVLTPA